MSDIRIPLTADETLDTGSFVLTEKEGNRYSFIGLSADVAKLPTVQAIGTGSTAMCADNGDFYMYEATTKTWNKL